MKASLKSILRWIFWFGASRRVRAENPYVVAVTGSVGKTTTKDALALVLAASGRPVFKTPGNLGSDMGLPLALLGFTEQPERSRDWLLALWRTVLPPIQYSDQRPYYVLEYSADAPGDIAFLCRRIKPQVGVLTMITAVHMVNYSSLQALVTEKATLVRSLSAGGYAVLNTDDPNQADLHRELPAVESYSVAALGKGLHLGAEGAHFTWEGHQVASQVLSREQVGALLAAATVGKREGISPEQIVQALENFQLPPGRGRLVAGREGVTIIDESYNASPDAVVAALRTLSEIAGSRRRVAILGRMNELGELADTAHAEVGKQAAQYVDLLVTVGQYAASMARAAQAAGLSAGQVRTFSTRDELITHLNELIKPHDMVMVKGSQNGVYFERVVKALMAHPEEAPTTLVRQTPFWQAFS